MEIEKRKIRFVSFPEKPIDLQTRRYDRVSKMLIVSELIVLFNNGIELTRIEKSQHPKEYELAIKEAFGNWSEY